MLKSEILVIFLLLETLGLAKQLYTGGTTGEQGQGLYHGYIEGNMLNGFGFWKLKTGNIIGFQQAQQYYGTYKKGQRVGYGMFESSGKYSYRGQVDQLPHGFGVQQWNFDSYYLVYVGNFKYGQHHGHGFLYNSSDKSVQVGLFSEGSFISGRTIKEEPYSKQKESSEHAYLFKERQDGKWWITYKNGKVDGEGSYKLNNGSNFWGYFTEENGQIKPIGKGVKKQGNEYWHIGEWGADSNPGLRHYLNGTSVLGQWSNEDELLLGQSYQVDQNLHQEYVLSRRQIELTVIQQIIRSSAQTSRIIASNF